MGLYECPSECADETPQEECTCSCPGLEEKIKSGEWQTLLELAFDIPAYLAEIQGKDNDTQVIAKDGSTRNHQFTVLHVPALG